MCAGTLARPSLEGTLRLVLGAGGAHKPSATGMGSAGGATAQPGSTGPGRALGAAAGVSKSTVCPTPAADRCRFQHLRLVFAAGVREALLSPAGVPVPCPQVKAPTAVWLATGPTHHWE